MMMRQRKRMPLGIQKLAFPSDSDCEIIKIANLILLLLLLLPGILLLPFTTTTIKIGASTSSRCPQKMQTRCYLEEFI